jgi:hypothetical protein
MARFLATDCAPTRYGMVGYILKNTLSEHGVVSRGVCRMNEHQHLETVTELTGIRPTELGIFYKNEDGEQMPLDGDALVSMNIWGFHPLIFDFLKKGFEDFVKANAVNPKAEFYISTFANHLIEAQIATFTVLPNDEKWFGVTYQADKPIVQKAFAEMTAVGKYPSPLWE